MTFEEAFSDELYKLGADTPGFWARHPKFRKGALAASLLAAGHFGPGVAKTVVGGPFALVKQHYERAAEAKIPAEVKALQEARSKKSSEALLKGIQSGQAGASAAESKYQEMVKKLTDEAGK